MFWFKIINLIFPVSCAGCGANLVKGEINICMKCYYYMPLTRYITGNMYSLGDRLKIKGQNIEWSGSMFYFGSNQSVRNIIHKIKYKNKPYIGHDLVYLYKDVLKERFKNIDIDEIVPVPLHSKRNKKRGYNQVQIFCESLAILLNKKVNNNVLFREIYMESQTKKTLSERKDVVIKGNVFVVNNIKENEDKHYLLVDDVITTGSTTRSCLNAMIKINNIKISFFSIASVR